MFVELDAGQIETLRRLIQDEVKHMRLLPEYIRNADLLVDARPKWYYDFLSELNNNLLNFLDEIPKAREEFSDEEKKYLIHKLKEAERYRMNALKEAEDDLSSFRDRVKLAEDEAIRADKDLDFVVTLRKKLEV